MTPVTRSVAPSSSATAPSPATAVATATTRTPIAGAVPGYFGQLRRRLFGDRDPVEAQLRDTARQGTFGAAISHFFATLLIVLFSTASLIALGADSMRAVLASLAHGTVDIPNAVATGVTALLVPAMDVAMLRAASKIRLLATRRATKSEMGLHIAVMSVISVIEAGTYCYMAAVYEHPENGVAWSLIAARALAAPLIGVYLAMDRPHPVTSRDILAQVELGAGAGVIRDVTEIANDPNASLDRKMELYHASAVMRESERERLQQLIDVAKRHASENGVKESSGGRWRIGAAATLPALEPPQEHHYNPTEAYNQMHDWEIPDEIEEDESDLFSTRSLPTFEAECVDSDEMPMSDTTEMAQRPRTRKNTGPKSVNLDRSRAVREYNRKLKSDAKAQRRAAIRDAVYAILDEWHAGGRVEPISDKELARRVAARVNFEVNPSGNTVSRWRGPWQASRAHHAAMMSEMPDDVAPMEPQELRELVAAQEAW